MNITSEENGAQIVKRGSAVITQRNRARRIYCVCLANWAGFW